MPRSIATLPPGRTLLTFLLVTAICCLSAVLGTAGRAAAHDQLVASTPGDGDALTSTPERFELRFSAELLDVGAVVLLVNQDEEHLATTAPQLAGETVSLASEQELPDGAYQLRWRVVSSDGHPISGVVPFTVGEHTAPTAGQTAQPDGPGRAADEPTASPSGAAIAPARSETGPVRFVIVGAAGAGIAVLTLLSVAALRRQRSRTDGERP